MWNFTNFLGIYKRREKDRSCDEWSKSKSAATFFNYDSLAELLFRVFMAKRWLLEYCKMSWQIQRSIKIYGASFSCRFQVTLRTEDIAMIKARELPAMTGLSFR